MGARMSTFSEVLSGCIVGFFSRLRLRLRVRPSDMGHRKQRDTIAGKVAEQDRR